MGFFDTDQLIYKDSRNTALINALASQPELFHAHFAASMVKLEKIQEGGGGGGEFRLKSRCLTLFVNLLHYI